MLIRLSAIAILLAVSFASNAQRNTIPCAIGSDGIVLNQRSIVSSSETTFSVTAIEDTIKLSAAQSLFALAVMVRTGDNIKVERVSSFTLILVDEKGDSTTFSCGDEKFSAGIINRLRELKTNSRLIFESIRYINKENPMHDIRTGMLMFYVL